MAPGEAAEDSQTPCPHPACDWLAVVSWRCCLVWGIGVRWHDGESWTLRETLSRGLNKSELDRPREGLSQMASFRVQVEFCSVQRAFHVTGLFDMAEDWLLVGKVLPHRLAVLYKA